MAEPARSIEHVERPWPRGLSHEDAALYLGIGVTTFDAMVEDGRMPKPKRVGRRVLWDRWEIDRAFSLLGKEDDQAADDWSTVAPR